MPRFANDATTVPACTVCAGGGTVPCRVLRRSLQRTICTLEDMPCLCCGGKGIALPSEVERFWRQCGPVREEA